MARTSILTNKAMKSRMLLSIQRDRGGGRGRAESSRGLASRFVSVIPFPVGRTTFQTSQAEIMRTAIRLSLG